MTVTDNREADDVTAAHCLALIDMMRRVGRLREASAADLQHAMRQAQFVDVELRIRLSPKRPWEITYARAPGD